MAKYVASSRAPTEGEDFFVQQVGLRIRDARIHAGMNRSVAGEFAGVVPSYLYTIEQGTANPTLRALYTIAKAYKLSPRDLLPGDSTEPELTDTGASTLVATLQRVVTVMAERQSQDAVLAKQLAELTRFLPDLEALVAQIRQSNQSEQSVDSAKTSRAARPATAKATRTRR